MPAPTSEIEEPLNHLDDSIVAQLIEVGLLARYKNDIAGSTQARRKIRAELLARGWVLPPHTYEGDVGVTVRHAGQPQSMAKMSRMYQYTEYPGIAAFIRKQTNTDAIRLDGRAIRMVFEAYATADDIAALTDGERALLDHIGVGTAD